MAKEKKRVQDNHVELGTVVPLVQPYVLMIDPSNICNHRCKFCPTGNSELIKATKRTQTLMDYDLYKKIINDIREFDEPIRVLRLYKEGEPLLNKKFPDMVSYAKDSGFVHRVDTTTNGICLNNNLNRQIVSAGLDQINISVNGVNSEQVDFYTRTQINFDQYVANIRDLYEHKGDTEIYIKAIKDNLSEEEQEKFLEIFDPICDRIFLERLSPAWPSFLFDSSIPMKYEAGNYGQEVLERSICPYIFYIMVINSDGKASYCVGDWKHCLIAGDTKNESLRSIWQGINLNKARLDHVEGNRACNSPFCASCEVVKYGTLDNLDPFKDEILLRLKKVTI